MYTSTVRTARLLVRVTRLPVRVTPVRAARLSVRALLIATSLVLIPLLTAACAYASAGGYGELTRFDGKGTNGKGTEFQLSGEETHAFAANPETGAVFVGDETAEGSEDLRIQGYSASGAFESEATIKRPGTLPTGIGGFEGYEGFALATGEKRIYVLATYKRFAEDGIDGSKVAAGALYALNSAPSSSGKLEPATGTGKEGLLGTTTTLGASSETQGQALLEPSGIAVDPLTGEVLILGLVDQGAGGLHAAVMHVSSSGSVLFTWVDPAATTAQTEPDSPVVTAGGELLFEAGDELLALPASASTGAPEVVFSFAEPEDFQTGPFAGELLSFGEGEATFGDGLSTIAEGSSEGRLVALAEVADETETGELQEKRNGALSLHYSEAGGHVEVGEVGWTGGVPGEGAPEPAKPCELGFAGGAPLVAAVGGDAIDVLAPAWPAVIELGPGGGGCPAAKESPSGLEPTIDGKRVSEVETGDTVTLAGRVVQGNVLSVEWIFGGEQPALVTTPAGEQTQTAQTTHKLATAGQLPVEAVVHTDDLATPELRFKTTLDVIEPGDGGGSGGGSGGGGGGSGGGGGGGGGGNGGGGGGGNSGGGGGNGGGSGGGGGGGGEQGSSQSQPGQSGSQSGSGSAPGGGVSDFKEAAPLATLATTSLSVGATGSLTLHVRCPGGVTVCSGTITLHTAAKKHALTLASGSFSVHGGQTGSVKLHLSARGRSLLAHAHSLHLLASILARNSAGVKQSLLSRVTLRSAHGR